jgi:hypothetical protein
MIVKDKGYHYNVGAMAAITTLGADAGAKKVFRQSWLFESLYLRGASSGHSPLALFLAFSPFPCTGGRA